MRHSGLLSASKNPLCDFIKGGFWKFVLQDFEYLVVLAHLKLALSVRRRCGPQTLNGLVDVFVSFLLIRNARIQADLVDQLFNSSEKRLARVLLLLAQFGKESTPETVVPKISQEILAKMIGTTRSRVSFFMNRFRKLGFVEYDGEIRVHNSLLNIFLQESGIRALQFLCGSRAKDNRLHHKPRVGGIPPNRLMDWVCPVIQRIGASIGTGHAGIVMPSCELSFPSFGRRMAFAELLRQLF